jgi:tetratricopeptide (TPR) repeat protein
LIATACLGSGLALAQELTHDEALQALQDPSDPDVRRAAVRALGESGTTADLRWLVAALRDEDSLVRAMAENAIWRVWSRSGDPEVDRLFVEGVAEMGARQLRRAVETFSRIIEMKPDFAEAWNKRATIYFWLGEHEKSLADCDEVMKRNPYHFGALSGYGMIYMRLDRPERAIEYLQRALAINPNLRQLRSTIEELERELRERGRDTT